MLKFIKHNMETIDGIATYPLISFVIFFVFFILLTAYVIFQRKEYFEEMSEMPLGDEELINPKKSTES